MIDKTTFIIVIMKLLGLQLILFGVFFALLTHRPIYEILICVGSLVFAIGSNILLAVNIHKFRIYRKERNNNG